VPSPAPAIVNCELSFIDRKPIDLATARQQHHAYEKRLGKLVHRVIYLLVPNPVFLTPCLSKIPQSFSMNWQ